MVVGIDNANDDEEQEVISNLTMSLTTPLDGPCETPYRQAGHPYCIAPGQCSKNQFDDVALLNCIPRQQIRPPQGTFERDEITVRVETSEKAQIRDHGQRLNITPWQLGMLAN